MGRRALRKIDPTLDLTGVYYDLESVSRPFDASAVFGRTAPLEIEVGSGKGMFLQTAAEHQPDRDFLGLEVARKYARYCAARLAKKSLANGKMICGDAGRFFREWLTDACAAAVHVYFPDPWWKKRHKKRRVLNELFVAEIERVLARDGRLHFWTDVEEYFEAASQMIASRPGLAGPFEETPASAPGEASANAAFRTHFDRRCQLENLPVSRAVFIRK